MTPAIAIAPNAVVAVAAMRALTRIASKRRRAPLPALALVRRPRARPRPSTAPNAGGTLAVA
jgi:hypothetical protein